MPFLTQNAVLLAKKEVTYGTDPVPTPAADSILASDIEPGSDVQIIPRSQFQRGTLSPLPPVAGKKFGTLSFSTEWKWNGNTAGSSATPWEAEPLFKGCGCSVTYTAEVGGDGTGKAVINPIDSAFDSITLYAYLNGVLHKLTGARGNFELIMPAGEMGIINWEFTGLYTRVSDAANPTGMIYDSQKAPTIRSSTFSVGAYAGIIQQAQFNLGNKVIVRASVNGAEGVAGVDIAGREPVGSINPEAVTEATYAFWSKLEAATEQALTIGLVGDTNGNQVKFKADKVVFNSMAWGDRDGFRIYDTPFMCALTSGADEFQMEFN